MVYFNHVDFYLKDKAKVEVVSLAKIRCRNGGSCRFDKNGICVKCGYDYMYKRIRVLFAVGYSFVISMIMLLFRYDISLIFPQSFLAEIIKAMSSANIVLGFLGIYFTFFAIMYIISPVYLLPIKAARKIVSSDCKKVMIINFSAGFTVVGWVAALIIAMDGEILFKKIQKK